MDRDFGVLNFLWKWKLASTAALSARFFSGKHPAAGYKALNQLRKYKLVDYQNFEIPDGRALWRLTRRGFFVVKELLPELREAGYLSEHVTHDWLTTAVQLGNWLVNEPAGVDLFSEQQLRRHHIEDYPSWVPHSDIHRGDGYWRVPKPNGKHHVIALEVERNVKTSYTFPGRFYEGWGVDHVVWLVPGKLTADRIFRRIIDAGAEKPDIHHFVLIPQFLALGWGASLYGGMDHGKTLASLLGNNAGTLGSLFPGHFLLDARKCPHRRLTYEREKERKKRPWVVGTTTQRYNGPPLIATPERGA